MFFTMTDQRFASVAISELMRMFRFSGLVISQLVFLWVFFMLPSYLCASCLPFIDINIVSVSEPS